MDAKEIELVQSSFNKVAPEADELAAIFYDNLFKLNPSLKDLFKSDMPEQGRKLMGTLSVVVQNLGDLAPVLPVAENLARRHVDYGVKAVDYDVVGEALLISLNQKMGGEFTNDMQAAWAKAYGTVADYMKSCAYA